MKKIILIATLFFLTSCINKEKLNKGFVLKGTIDNIEDQIKIKIISNNKVLDSVLINNGKFEFKGFVDEPKKIYLKIDKTKDISSIWLENSEISFSASKGGFRNAKITGSKLQKVSDTHYKNFRKYLKEGDSIYKISINKNFSKDIRERAKKEYKDNYSNRRKLDYSFIENNPKSLFSAYLLDFYSTTFGKQETKKLYNNFSKEISESSYGQSINEFIELNSNLQIGDNYVDFSLNDIKGNTVRLSDFEGKYILLEFWNTNCSPCIKEFPYLKNTYNNLRKEGFEIVSVSDDKSKDKWLNLIKKENLEWRNLRTKNGTKDKVYKIYGINGVPSNFLINKKGVIIAQDLRGNKLIDKLKQVVN